MSKERSSGELEAIEALLDLFEHSLEAVFANGKQLYDHVRSRFHEIRNSGTLSAAVLGEACRLLKWVQVHSLRKSMVDKSAPRSSHGSRSSSNS